MLKTSRDRPSVFLRIVSKKVSTPLLNSSIFFSVGFIRYIGCRRFNGRRLKSFGALLKKEASLMVCTQSGARRSILGLI